MRWNSPPNWPAPPVGWTPPADWRPDTAWGPVPDGWVLWVDDADVAALQVPQVPQAPSGQPGLSVDKQRECAAIAIAVIGIAMVVYSAIKFRVVGVYPSEVIPTLLIMGVGAALVYGGKRIRGPRQGDRRE